MARPAAALLAAALAAAPARAQVAKQAPYVPVMLQLSGACDTQWVLNGLMFELRGYTANGSPYYKARARQEYMYYDPDCTGGGDGTARWILDQDEPSLTRLNDLDSDSSCEYRARINSLDGTRPPYTGTWKMKCAQGWTDQFLTFLETTTTGTTSTTVTRTGSTLRTTTSTEGPDFVLRPGFGTGVEVPPGSRQQLPVPGSGVAYTPAAPLPGYSPEGKPAAAPLPAGYPSNATGIPGKGQELYPGSAANATANKTGFLGEAFTLSGACPEKGFLNGLLFKKQGTTASGAPYYRSSGTPQYIYWEPACDGNTASPQPRWVIDDDAPDPKAEADLDKDGACDYHARLLSADKTEPPAIATWRMFCAGSWADVQLVLERSKAPGPQVIMVNGASGSTHCSAAAVALMLGAPIWRAGC